MKNILLFALVIGTAFQLCAQQRNTENISSNNVSIIKFAATGKVWVASPGAGCAVFDPSNTSWGNFRSANTIMKSDSVTGIDLYSINAVPHSFMATTNGVYYRHGVIWDSLPGLADAHATGIIRSPDNKLYISTKAGISVFKADSLLLIANYNTGNSNLPAGNITSLQFKQIPNVNGFFAATSDSGYFYTTDAVSYTKVNTTNSSLLDNQVNFIMTDTTANIHYVGTKGGLSINNAGTFKNLTTAQGLRQNDVTTVGIDCYGNLWIGTRDSGVAIYDGLSVIAILNKNNALNSSKIRSINCNVGCDCWVGTVDEGITIFDSMRVVKAVLTGVNDVVLDKMNVSVFPQPAGDVMNFTFGQEIANGELSLFDMNGKMVASKNISHLTTATINTRTLQQGIYFYSIRDERNVFNTGKVSVIH